MSKKIVSLLLTLCLMCMAVNAGAAVTSKGTFPVVDEPITLTVAVPVNAKVEDIHTNAYTIYLEEQTGIDLEIIELSPSDTSTQINTIMLSGDLPDMFIGYNFGYDELASYAEAGYIAPLNEYVEKYGDEYFTFLEEVKDAVGDAAAYVTVDGNIYAVPGVTNMILNMYAANRIRIPQVFLDNLGMEAPTTLEEFYNYLVAVRDQDANGNGDPNDEIPMTGTAEGLHLLNNIGNSFQYTEQKNYLKVTPEGKIEFIATNDEFRQTVEFIKKLVDEKLLDPAAFTQDRATLLTLNTQEYSLIGADASYLTANYDASTLQSETMRIMPNLVGPNGYSATRMDVPGVARALVITTACEHPDAAYRLCDFILNEYASAVARMGTENVDWKRAPEGAIGNNGEQAWYEYISVDPWTRPTQNSIWRMEGFFHSDIVNHVAAEEGNYLYYLAQLISEYKLVDGITGEHLPQLIMDPETSIEYNEVKGMILNYVNENVAKFALGDRSLDEWDDYVKTLNDIGVEYYVQTSQEAYDAMMK